MNSPDTWGIPGHTFLLLYVVMIVMTAVAVVMRRIGTRDIPMNATRRLSPAETGLLFSDRNAILAALAELRTGQLVGSTGAPVASTTGGARIDPFTRAVFDNSPLLTRRDGKQIRRPLTDLRRRLADLGLMHRHPRIVGVDVMIPVIVVGVLRLRAGSAAHKPIGILTMLVVGLIVIALVLLVTPKRLTHSGTATRRRVGMSLSTLHPRYKPSVATYGPTKSALGVAAFGIGSLSLIDPILASQYGFSASRAVMAGAGVSWSMGTTSGTGPMTGGHWISAGGGSEGSVGSCGGGGGGCGGGGCGG